MTRAFDRDEPEYLDWAIPVEACTEAQSYRIYYYRGLGFFFLSDFENALLYLNLAKAIGGPEDEQVLHYLWRIHGKLGDAPDQTRLIWEFHNRFPQSTRLGSMYREWQSNSRQEIPWSFSAANSMSHSTSPGYTSTRIRNKISAALDQRVGEHRFRQSAGLAANSAGARKILDEWQGYLAGTYRYGGLSLNLNWGASYARPIAGASSVDTALAHGRLASDQYQAGIGYSRKLGKATVAEIRLDGFHPRSGWTMANLSQSVSTLTGDFLFLGTWGAERHWMSFFAVEPFFPTLQGLWVGNLGTTACYDRGRHGLSLGAEYRWEQEIIAPAQFTDPGFPIEMLPNVGQTLAAILGYAYRPSTWLDIELQGKWGRETNSESSDGGILQGAISFTLHR